TRRRLVLPEVWIQLLELPCFPRGSPAEVAAVGVAQVERRDLLKAARCVKARGQFVGQRFVVNELLLMGGADGPLIQTFRIQLPAFEAGDLRPDQRSTVLEILQTILRPSFEPPVMRRQCLQVPSPLRGGRLIAECGPRERSVKGVVYQFEIERARPEKSFSV